MLPKKAASCFSGNIDATVVSKSQGIRDIIFGGAELANPVQGTAAIELGQKGIALTIAVMPHLPYCRPCYIYIPAIVRRDSIDPISAVVP